MLQYVKEKKKEGKIMSVEELKALQSKVIEKNKKCNRIAISVFLLLFGITIFMIVNHHIFFWFGIVLFEVVISIISVTIVKAFLFGNDVKQFNNEFKHTFVEQALEQVFDHLTYDPTGGIDQSVIRPMMNIGDAFHSNDYVSGTYKEVRFEQSDIHIEEEHRRTDKDGKTETEMETIFQGRWMIFDFNKQFKANIQVVGKQFRNGIIMRNRKTSRVRLEDEAFHQMFSVFSDDEHEAFYVLTPHFMEKLKNISRQLDGTVMFCFVENKLHIAIHNNKDSFEHNIFKVIDEEKIEQNIMKDIKTITEFVDALDLENTLFR